jgi:outer membrane lipoprotein-sorting protein
MEKLFLILLFCLSWTWVSSQAGMMLQKKSSGVDTTHVTITMAISASGNDAEQEGTTVFTTSSDLEMCWDGADADVGVGFDGHASLTQGINGS